MRDDTDGPAHLDTQGEMGVVGVVMDEIKSRPGFPGDRSQAAAEKLRALRERANQALEGHRSRLSEIETQLNDRVRQLAEDFGASLGETAVAVAPGAHEEVEELRRQLAEGNAKHAQFVAQLHAAREQLNAIQSQPCAVCEQAAAQLAAADDEQRRLRVELQSALREHEVDRARHTKFVEQLAAARQAITVLQHAAGESSAEARAEVEAMRAAKAAVEQQLAAAQRELQALSEECNSIRPRIAELESNQSADQAEIDKLRRELAAQQQNRETTSGEVLELRRQVEALTAQATAAEGERRQLADARDAASAALNAAQASQQAAEVALQTAQAARDAAQKEFTAALSAATSEHAVHQELLAAAEAETTDLRQRLAQSETERLNLSLAVSQAESVSHEYQQRLERAEATLETLRGDAQAGAEAPALRAELAKAQNAADEKARAVTELAATLDQARRDLATLRDSMTPKADLDAARDECHAAQAAIAELQAVVKAAHANCESAQAEVAVARSDAAETRRLLATAQAETDAVRDASRPVEEFAELQQKFELALADVQKLKRENGGLREELAERPAASDCESPDLISLRSDRDTLAARVAELEALVAAAAGDADAQQEREDLQRRFEMAVDDVRQLKQENAQLRDKLSAGKHAGGGEPEPAGAGDWASQRARLMALLEEEDESGPVPAERVTERATVAKTIAATDRVIASKDEEIAALRSALESRNASVMVDENAVQRETLLDGDEVVAAERERLAALHLEWEEKLRSAELEFSIERAKLAREQAALRDKMLEFERSGGTAAPQMGPIDVKTPRRKWLSALGLHDDNEETGKKK